MFEFQPCRLAVADWHHLVTTSAASETGQKAHLSDKKTAASGLVKADPTFALSRRIGRILSISCFWSRTGTNGSNPAHGDAKRIGAVNQSAEAAFANYGAP